LAQGTTPTYLSIFVHLPCFRAMLPTTLPEAEHSNPHCLSAAIVAAVDAALENGVRQIQEEVLRNVDPNVDRSSLDNRCQKLLQTLRQHSDPRGKRFEVLVVEHLLKPPETSMTSAVVDDANRRSSDDTVALSQRTTSLVDSNPRVFNSEIQHTIPEQREREGMQATRDLEVALQTSRSLHTEARHLVEQLQSLEATHEVVRSAQLDARMLSMDLMSIAEEAKSVMQEDSARIQLPAKRALDT